MLSPVAIAVLFFLLWPVGYWCGHALEHYGESKPGRKRESSTGDGEWVFVPDSSAPPAPPSSGGSWQRVLGSALRDGEDR